MLSRRRFFSLAAGLSPLLLLPSARADQDACAGLNSLSRSQRGLRNALGFQIRTEGERQCHSCAFFTPASADSGCGSCSLFADGPVYADSSCDSWAVE